MDKCSKIGYRSSEGALRGIERSNRRNGWALKAAYKCPFCSLWHNTSMLPKKMR